MELVPAGRNEATNNTVTCLNKCLPSVATRPFPPSAKQHTWNLIGWVSTVCAYTKSSNCVLATTSYNQEKSTMTPGQEFSSKSTFFFLSIFSLACFMKAKNVFLNGTGSWHHVIYPKSSFPTCFYCYLISAKVKDNRLFNQRMIQTVGGKEKCDDSHDYQHFNLWDKCSVYGSDLFFHVKKSPAIACEEKKIP